MSGAVSVQHGAFGRAGLYRLDRAIVTHAHREAHIVFHVGGAEADIPVGDRTVRIGPGSAAAISPWEAHGFDPLPRAASPTDCLVLYIDPAWFRMQASGPDAALTFGGPRVAVTPDIARWAGRLTEMLRAEDRSTMFDGALYETASRCFARSWAQGGARPGDARRVGDFRVRRSLELMKERFADEIGIDWVARESGLSRPHFFKLFKRETGVTPNLYLNTLRAEKAIEDLLRTARSVTDIGYDLGFSSQASFTRFFSSNVGIPPSDYRRAALG